MNLSPLSCLFLPSLKVYVAPENKAKSFPALQMCTVPLNKPAFLLGFKPMNTSDVQDEQFVKAGTGINSSKEEFHKRQGI